MARIDLSPPDVRAYERVRLFKAFDKKELSIGPEIAEFESDFVDYTLVPHVVALSSGSAALHLALLVNGIGQGDIVITSTLTVAATAFAVSHVGATPVFVDVDPKTWTLDCGLLQEALVECRRNGTPAKAVISVDVYGQACDYDAIVALCEAHGAVLIDDAAQAMGALYRNKHVGNHAMCTVFSFNDDKIMTTASGGMLVSHDAELVARARHLANQAREPVGHYEHVELGYNYLMSNLSAAIGCGQLVRLDEMMARRKEIRDTYYRALRLSSGITFMPIADYGTPNYWLTCLLVDPEAAGVSRDQIAEALEQEDIETRRLWKPLHLQPVFRECRMFGGKVAEEIFDKGICLPSGAGMKEDAQSHVIRTLAEILTMRTNVYAPHPRNPL